MEGEISFSSMLSIFGSGLKYHGCTYVENGLPLYVLGLLDRNDGQLEHHGEEAVATKLFSNTAHDQFVSDGADEEGDEHGDWFGEVGERGEVDMAPEKVVYGDVPFPGEFQPE